MKRVFTTQQERQQQQLKSTGRYDDSTITEELVANREQQEERSSKRILIVDDKPAIAFTLRIILEENGFKEVDVYNEPLLALQNFKSCVYSLLITDVAMPRMDGFELYKQIRKIDDRIKVMFMTAYFNYEALKELFPFDVLDRTVRTVANDPARHARMVQAIELHAVVFHGAGVRQLGTVTKIRHGRWSPV